MSHCTTVVGFLGSRNRGIRYTYGSFCRKANCWDEQSRPFNRYCGTFGGTGPAYRIDMDASSYGGALTLTFTFTFFSLIAG